MSWHVAPRGKKWSVRRAGKNRAARLHASKEAALEDAKLRGGAVYVHGENGLIETVVRHLRHEALERLAQK